MYAPVRVAVLHNRIDEGATGFVEVTRFDNQLGQFMRVVGQEQLSERR